MTGRLSETLLVADDDETFRSRLGKAFEKKGFRILLACDVAAALQLLEKEIPQKAVVDLCMPHASGLDLVKVLKTNFPTCEVVVLTGYGSIATSVEAMRLGACNYLTKPADADEILAAFEPNVKKTDESITAASLARVEWEHIQRILKDCEGNVSQAARILGLHRRSLQRKLSKNPVSR